MLLTLDFMNWKLVIWGKEFKIDVSVQSLVRFGEIFGKTFSQIILMTVNSKSIWLQITVYLEH